jgi:hypothetical protein
MREARMMCLQDTGRAAMMLALRAAAAKTNREGFGLSELKTAWLALPDAQEPGEQARDVDA